MNHHEHEIMTRVTPAPIRGTYHRSRHCRLLRYSLRCSFSVREVAADSRVGIGRRNTSRRQMATMYVVETDWTKKKERKKGFFTQTTRQGGLAVMGPVQYQRERTHACLRGECFAHSF